MGANLAERDTIKLQQSAMRGAEASQLLDHPLIRDVITQQAEKVTQALLSLPVASHEERLALCTVLRVLRGLPEELKKMASDGDYDAKQLASLNKDKIDA